MILCKEYLNVETQNTSLTPDKELNSLIYGKLFHVNTYF